MAAPTKLSMKSGSGRSAGSRCTYVASVNAGEWCPSSICTCLARRTRGEAASVSAKCQRPFVARRPSESHLRADNSFHITRTTRPVQAGHNRNRPVTPEVAGSLLSLGSAD
jgi:hypothetical protein